MMEKTTKDKIETILKKKDIRYALINAENSRYLFTCYCYSKGESLIVKEILEKEKSKYHIIIIREKF